MAKTPTLNEVNMELHPREIPNIAATKPKTGPTIQQEKMNNDADSNL